MIVDIEASELSILDRILIPMRIKDIVGDPDLGIIHVELDDGTKLSYRLHETILVEVIRGR